MSYDLYFVEPQIGKEDFFAYFRGRRNYQVLEGQAVYENQDTGVYFLIDYNQPGSEDTDAIASTASASINYYRPSFFGLEVAEEISAMVNHFGFSIHDPQNEGMGDGPFSEAGFLRAWNHGNEFGYSAILRGEKSPKAVWSLPGERLEKIWRWNYKKAEVQELLTEDCFVPRIFMMIIAAKPVSVAVWPDAISELIPEVDYLFIGRDVLAPKKLFGSRQKDHVLVPFAEFRNDFEPYATLDYILKAYKLPAPQVPVKLQERVRGLRANGISGEGVTMDQVLNSEIVAKFETG